MNKKQAVRTILSTLAVMAISFAVSYSQALYVWDRIVTDPLYQRGTQAPDHTIRILAIDEKTLAAYGEYADWSRDIPARLVEVLNADPDQSPAVIAFDVLYVNDRDERSDQAFADACEQAGNVVSAVNVRYRDAVSTDGTTIAVDTDHIEGVEYPYPALRDAVSYGFANTCFDRDQYVRFARLSVAHQGETIWSLPAAIYRAYAQRTGREATMPRTDSQGLFDFAYTGPTGSYEVVSLCDVLEGRIDARFFTDCIVLVGAYAPGMQDSYNVPVQRGTQMYGVEIQANILQAIQQGRTALPMSSLAYAALVALIAGAYYLASRRMGIVAAALTAVAAIAVYVCTAGLLYAHGVVLRVIEPILAVAVIYLIHLVEGYLVEVWRRRRILSAFRKYVAPQVVQEVAEKGDFSIELGGEKRHIAVLFVDIRGFTPLSEGLAPEEVVEILNEYLALTTKAIFDNHGTLDKFIGDATMAVFNAPFDQDDYVYQAVCAARDIAAGSEELDRRLRERFGRSISFGIGVNCGDAVVGNIGCDFRMDYTAIGDTVNTAARLESNAARGQILISQAVYDQVRNRVRVTEMGAIPLKGKSTDVFVYQLDEVL